MRLCTTAAMESPCFISQRFVSCILDLGNPVPVGHRVPSRFFCALGGAGHNLFVLEIILDGLLMGKHHCFRTTCIYVLMLSRKYTSIPPHVCLCACVCMRVCAGPQRETETRADEIPQVSLLYCVGQLHGVICVSLADKKSC